VAELIYNGGGGQQAFELMIDHVTTKSSCFIIESMGYTQAGRGYRTLRALSGAPGRRCDAPPDGGGRPTACSDDVGKRARADREGLSCCFPIRRQHRHRRLLVKVAQLRGGRAGVRAFAARSNRCRASSGGARGGADSLVEAIRQAMRRAGIRARSALIALRAGMSRRASAPFPRPIAPQLQRVVEYDLADHIPFPVEQVVVDFQSLGPSLDQPGMVDVLVVAAQRDLVRQYTELARALNLRVAALTVDAFALQDLVSRRRDTAPGVSVAWRSGGARR